MGASDSAFDWRVIDPRVDSISGDALSTVATSSFRDKAMEHDVNQAAHLSRASSADSIFKGEILVTSRSTAVAEVIGAMERRGFPQPDCFALRVLLTEAVCVARRVGCDSRIGEQLLLRFQFLRDECIQVRLSFCGRALDNAAPRRLRRRRCRAFEQLSYLVPFSTAHRIEENDGSLTFERRCRQSRQLVQACGS